MNLTQNPAFVRKAASPTVPVHPLLAERWSPRGFDRAHEIGDEAMVTQAQADGLAVHQMGGFDTDAVRAGFALADALTPVVVLAAGRQDGAAGLPAPLAAREAAPRTRHPVSDLLLPVPAARPLAA